MTPFFFSSPAAVSHFDSSVSGQAYLLVSGDLRHLSISPSQSFDWVKIEVERSVEESLMERGGPSELALRQAQRRLTTRALAFLEQVVGLASIPDVDVDRDSDVRLSWHGGPGRRVVVTLSDANVLHYAVLSPGRRLHGQEMFVGDVPSVLKAELVRLEQRLA